MCLGPTRLSGPRVVASILYQYETLWILLDGKMEKQKLIEKKGRSNFDSVTIPCLGVFSDTIVGATRRLK